MPSFFAERAGGRVTITGADARHLARSLRARIGEEIEVVDPAGFLLTARLDAVSPDLVEGVVVSERPHQPEPAAKITIAVAGASQAAIAAVEKAGGKVVLPEGAAAAAKPAAAEAPEAETPAS